MIDIAHKYMYIYICVIYSDLLVVGTKAQREFGVCGEILIVSYRQRCGFANGIKYKTEKPDKTDKRRWRWRERARACTQRRQLERKSCAPVLSACWQSATQRASTQRRQHKQTQRSFGELARIVCCLLCKDDVNKISNKTMSQMHLSYFRVLGCKAGHARAMRA